MTKIRFSQFIRFQMAVWTVFVIFIFPAKLDIEKSLTGALGSFFLHDGISIALTFGMSPIYDRIYRRHEDFLWLGSAIVVLCASAGFIQLIVFRLIGDIYPSEHRTIFGSSVALGIFYFRFGVFICWSLLYLVIKHLREGSSRELQMLRAQMNPHLLSNALEHVLAEVEPHLPKTAAIVQSLMNYFNYSLRHQKDDFVAMGEEYDALTDFLKLEKSLFGEKVDIACRIEASARTLKVPGVFLQPLVENAVKYGLRTRRPPVIVRLAVECRESHLIVEVCNTGHWVVPDDNRTIGGIGLNNLRRRLARLYGRKYQFVTFEEEGWVTVRITLPINYE